MASKYSDQEKIICNQKYNTGTSIDELADMLIEFLEK